MKISLKIFALMMAFVSSLNAQNIFKTIQTAGSQPITTQGISIPQLITTDINRSTLTFNFQATRTGYLGLSGNYNYFKSDKNKQIRITANLGTTKDIDRLKDIISNNTGTSVRASMGVNAKFFNSKNQFIEFGLTNNSSRYLLSPLSSGQAYQTYNLGIGKGRIDYITDGSVALTLIEALEKAGVITQSLSEEEVLLLKDKIASLKNDRRFVNRTYSLTEVAEIKSLLSSFGVLNEEIQIESLINDHYRYEQLIERTTGSQLLLSANYGHTLLTSENRFTNNSFGLNISYATHKYINDKIQLNATTSLYTQETNYKYNENFPIIISTAGISQEFDLNYFFDNKSRLGFNTTIGYNFQNRELNPLSSNLITENPYFFLNYGLEYEFRTSRQSSVTLGINGTIRKGNSSSGISLGIKF